MVAAEEIVVTPPESTISYPSVHRAWLAVMDQVRAVGKDGRYEGGKTRYNFRGIDGVVNAVGPALRAHGVHVRPVSVKAEYRDAEAGSNRTLMRECTVNVTYRVTGPAGDHFDGEAQGEALDSSDKGSAKAQSVAFRVFLLQALTIPTDEPDPDESHHERATAPEPVDDYTPGLRSSVDAAIAKLDEAGKAALKEWFAEADLPAVRRMNADQLARTIDHLMDLPVAQPESVGADA